jgi:LuxR family maltose regulon positive regulatory protein
MDGNVGAAVTAGRLALELERGGPASPWRPVGCPVLGLSLHWAGDREAASGTLTEAVRIARADGNHLAAMHATGGLAAIAYERGDVASASSRAAEATALAQQHDLGEHWASSLSLAIQGQVLSDADDLDAADQALARALEVARRGVASIEIAYALLCLAHVRRRLGDDEEARRLLDEAHAAVAGCIDPGILRERLARNQRRMHQGRLRAADDRTGADELTDAELSVLWLLRGELSQREIAAELHLSFNTIKTHTRSIYRKLGANTRGEALAHARELSLI